MVDTLKFRVQCKKCIENGDKTKNLEITEEEDLSSDEDTLLECHSHSNQKGIFYCDDCKVFLCKLCFANEHRSHKSNLPIDIAKEFKEDLSKMIESVSEIKPKIEESLKTITELDVKIKSMREISLKKMKDFITKINSIMKEKSEKKITKFEHIFEGLDIEIENIEKRLDNLSKKSSKYIGDLSEIQTQLKDENKSDVALCEYRKKKSITYQETIKLLDDSKNFINYKIEIIKSKTDSKLEVYKAEVEKFFKQLQTYEKSIMNSISTGISSSSLRIRRFNKFSKRGLKYYKTSSLQVKANSNICLVGLGVCGLYIHSKELETIKMLDKSLNSSDKSRSFDYSIYKPVNNGPQTIKYIPVQISISEIKQDNDKAPEVIISESHNINGIVNSTDPTYIIYLNKAVHIKAERKYIITLTNLYKESYIEIWCGEVSKQYLKNMDQNITCNSSRINFDFTCCNGIESDFNEFNQGIIADLLYSYID